MSGQEVTFDVDGSSKWISGDYRAQPNAPGVIVLHAWWGLN